MRLQSIELCGFKSFPDRTVLSFSDGVTAVVGPNGSGKSNISDAVRWVLGELSSRSIRGNKMEDVIFNGTGKRKAMNYAEVSLTIDNTDPENRMNIDYDQVTVTRRYFRGGESEYLINRRPVRLRDINELFMNTGIGRDGYSLIGQGRAAEIISQKSDERRQVFEEAAGVARYRYQKADAEKKLSEVDDNLTRINDIAAEVAARLGPLEKESGRARQYLELYGERKEAEVSLWLYDIAGRKADAETSEKAFEIARHELEIADDAINSLEAQNEKLYQSVQENKNSTEQRERLIGEDTQKQYKLTSDAAVAENDVRHLEKSIAALRGELEIRRRMLDDSAEKRKTAAASRDKAAAALSEAKEQRAAVEKNISALSQTLDRLSDEIDRCETALRGLEKEKTETNVRLSALEGAGRSDAARREALLAEQAEKEQSAALLKQRMEQARTSVEEYKRNADAIAERIAVLKEKQDALAQAGANDEREMSHIRLDINSRRQNIDNLRRMEELLEGYAQAVRAVIRAADEGKLAGIVGPVSRVVSVQPKYAVAIETALGANIQNIITEDENAAKSAIAYLKNTNAGRCTFYPLTSMKGTPLNVDRKDLEKCAGYLGVASELAAHDARFDNIIEYMLGRTVVFDNLDNASVTARRFGYRVRAVTLDGQLINAGGSYTGGSVRRDSGMLTRTSEIARIEGEVSRLTLKGKALSEKLAESEAEKRRIASDMTAEGDRLAMIRSLANAEDTQRQVLAAQAESDAARLKSIREELARLKEDAARSDGEAKACRDRLSDVQRQTAALTAERDEKRGSQTGKRREYDRAVSDGNGLLVRITAAGKDLEAAEDALRLQDTTAETIRSSIENTEKKIYDSDAEVIRKKNQIETFKAEADALAEDIARLQKERGELLSGSRELESETTAVRTKLRERHHERETLYKSYAELENETKRLNGEVDRLTARLWEEYELTVPAAAELAYPAVTPETRENVSRRAGELRQRIKALGPVNTAALQEYKEAKERHEFLTKQQEDLTTSRTRLREVLQRLESEMKIRFTDAMNEINVRFGETFRELFGGGDAELVLTDPTDVLNCGIEINVAPPGKIIKSLSLLSGGEQSFVAIALFFAILKVNPTPFCILDEIEAALDEVNVVRFAEYARKYSDTTQFILITHRRGSMEEADRLYGVTMYERGVSKVLTLDVGEVESRLGVKL